MALGHKIWLFAVPGVLSQQSTKTVLFFHISEDTWIKYIKIKFPSLTLRHSLLEQKKKNAHKTSDNNQELREALHRNYKHPHVSF